MLVVGTGFEPVYGEAEQIYSLPPLTTRTPHQQVVNVRWKKADYQDRTGDLLITNQLLCQLS